MTVRVCVMNPCDLAPGLDPAGKHLRCYRQIMSDAACSADSSVTLEPSPDKADVVLIPSTDGIFGHFFEYLIGHPFYREHRDRALAYSTDDLSHLSVPGIYPACTPFFERTGWALPAHYRMDHLPSWNFTNEELQSERDLLFSFVGAARTHPVRPRVLSLSHPGSLLVDASVGSARWWDRSLEEQAPFKERFRASLLRSRFVLCPRGVSATSIRIFEAMEAASVPVIIADDICLPHGPQWEEFSLQVPESDVAGIPKLLESRAEMSSAMGRAARRAWESFFSPSVSFRSLGQWAVELLAARRAKNQLLPRLWAATGCYLKPRPLKLKARKAIAAISGAKAALA